MAEAKTKTKTKTKTIFKIERKGLLKLFEQAARATAKKSTIQTAEMVLARWGKFGLSLTGNDFTIAIENVLKVKVDSGDEGELIVPHEKAINFLKMAKGDTVAFQTVGEDRLRLRCGRSQITLQGLSTASATFERPSYFLKQMPEAKLSSASLKELLDSALILADKTEIAAVDGIHLVVSTESLVIFSAKRTGSAIFRGEIDIDNKAGLEFSASFPKVKMRELAVLCQDVETWNIGFERNLLRLEALHLRMGLFSLEGEAPDFEGLITMYSAQKNDIQMKAKDLAGAVQLVESVFSSGEKFTPCRLTPSKISSESLRITSEIDNNEAYADLPLAESSKLQKQLIFDLPVLLAIARNLDNEIIMHYQDGHKPVVIKEIESDKPERKLYLLAPIIVS